MPIISDKHIQFGYGDIGCFCYPRFEKIILHQIKHPVGVGGYISKDREILREITINLGRTEEDTLIMLHKCMKQLKTLSENNATEIVVNDIIFEFCGDDKYKSVDVVYNWFADIARDIIFVMAC